MLTHKGLRGQYELDQEAGYYHGEIIGISDVVTFQGKTMEALTEAFQDSVDDYLSFVAENDTEQSV